MVLPLVSVVIPTFERPNYLKRSINSVLLQDYEQIEIIVVIDGESKITKKILEQYKKNSKIKIRTIETGKKVGGSEARNIGVKNSVGAFIAFLDDDDEWLQDKVSSQIELIQSENLTENDNFICFTSLYTYKSGFPEKLKKLPRVNFEDSKNNRIIDYLFEPVGFYNQGFMQTSTILIPKKIFEKVPFTKGLVKHQDWDWLINLEQRLSPKVIQVTDPKVIFHTDVPETHRVGISNKWRFSEKWLDNKKSVFTDKGYASLLFSAVIIRISASSLSFKEKILNISKQFKKLPIKSFFNLYSLKSIIYVIKNLV